MLTVARRRPQWGASLELLALVAAAGGWAWWLGPQQRHALAWAPLPGWTGRIDGLSLVFLTLFLAVPAPLPAGSPGPPPGPDGSPGPPPARRARLPAMGWGVCRAGLALTALSGTTAGQIAGLALAGAGLALAAWPLGPARALAPALLVPLALSGAFDLLPTPGRPVAVLSWPLVGLALAAAAGGTGAWPFAGGRTAPAPPPGTARGAWMAMLYGAGSLLPLLRSLSAGPWDPWARLAVLAVGLLTLAAATCAALAAADLPAVLRATRDYLVGALLVGLGLGTPAAVGGGLLLFVAGLAGLALATGGRAAQIAGGGASAGLPPTLGFAGLWLLLGAAASAGAPLALAAVPVAGLLIALAGARLAPPPGRTRPAAALLAGGLVLGGLLPGPFLDGVLRPALDALAAGLPALSALQPWPGVGLILTAGPRPEAVWPAWGLAATLVLTLAATEAGALLAGLRRRLAHHGGTESTAAVSAGLVASALPNRAEAPASDFAAGDALPPSEDRVGRDQGPGPLVHEAGRWAAWLDPARLVRAGLARRAGRRGR